MTRGEAACVRIVRRGVRGFWGAPNRQPTECVDAERKRAKDKPAAAPSNRRRARGHRQSGGCDAHSGAREIDPQRGRRPMFEPPTAAAEANPAPHMKAEGPGETRGHPNANSSHVISGET